MKEKRISDETMQSIEKLYAEGLSTTVIAERVGVSYGTVYNHTAYRKKTNPTTGQPFGSLGEYHRYLRSKRGAGYRRPRREVDEVDDGSEAVDTIAVDMDTEAGKKIQWEVIGRHIRDDLPGGEVYDPDSELILHEELTRLYRERLRLILEGRFKAEKAKWNEKASSLAASFKKSFGVLVLSETLLDVLREHLIELRGEMGKTAKQTSPP